jgi:biopolymer transport protein ExbB
MFELDPVIQVRAFLETGGQILMLIGIVTLAMWTLMLERFWYFRRLHPQRRQEVLERWGRRSDRSSWEAHQIRRLYISYVGADLQRGVTMIQTLVALCPLLGLLGTVTGMIEVFDVISIGGSGNARALASGVSRATIPTMAGMVAALSGLILAKQIERYSHSELERVADQMTIEHA